MNVFEKILAGESNHETAAQLHAAKQKEATLCLYARQAQATAARTGRESAANAALRYGAAVDAAKAEVHRLSSALGLR